VAETAPPVFTVTPVDMAFNPVDSSYGDIPFIAPVLRPFGDALSGFQRYSPVIEYFPVVGAPVRAVTDGIVDEIIPDSIYADEYTIVVVAIPESQYLITYHHVVSPTTLVNAAVATGETLGAAGNWSDELARTGLEISVGQNADKRSYCPLDFGDAAFVEHHRQLVNEYIRRGFSPAYDTLCVRDYVTPF
jgi:hypothetical protein